MRILCALLLCLTAGKASALEVQVLSALSGAIPDPDEKLVRLGEEVTLYLAVKGEGLAIVSAAPKVRLRGSAKAQKARSPEAGAFRVRWFRIEVAERALSNTDPSFHWHPIEYRDVPIGECDDRFTCPALVRTRYLGDRGGLGTMAFKAKVEWQGRRGASVGSEKRYRGGLVPEVARVSVRRDDSYLGFLTELFNTPYIWGSAGDDAVHQAERRIGSDCADFVTYGVRRLGHKVPYTSTWQLGTYTRTLASSAGPSEDGLYRDAQQRPIAVGPEGLRPGDLFLFSGHVGAFLRDEPPLGVLSKSDIMIHTLWSEPEEVALEKTQYVNSAVKLLRWKAFETP